MLPDYSESTFLADAVIDRLRARVLPSEDEAPLIDQLPLIGALRDRVTADDVPVFLRAVNEASSAAAGLCASLLRRHMRAPAVRRAFEERWHTADPYLKNRLMWRLLDLPDLPGDWHERFFQFVFEEWSVFSAFNRTFYGPEAAASRRLFARVLDPTFPDSKKWIYFCCVPSVTSDPDVVAGFMSLGKLMTDPMIVRACDAVRDRYAELTSAPGQTAPPDLGSKGLGFLASAVIEKLRTGARPTEKDADGLNRLPFVDVLRATVKETDLPWIWDGIQPDGDEQTGLCLSLLRRWTGEVAVQERLRNLWQQATPFVRAHLLWRILDDSGLPEQWHEQLFGFVLDSWTDFHAVSAKFLGPKERILVTAIKRLADPAFPASKHWSYFCRVPGQTEDPVGERAFLTLGCGSADAFTRKVCIKLLELTQH
jgi:hypothetical protein